MKQLPRKLEIDKAGSDYMTPAEKKLKSLGFGLKSVDESDPEEKIYHYQKIFAADRCKWITSLDFYIGDNEVSAGLLTTIKLDDGRESFASAVINQDELNAIQERCKELEPAK